MARRAPPNAAQDDNKPTTTGGASGSPDDHLIPEAVKTIVMNPGQPAQSAKQPLRTPVHVPVTRYRVVQGGRVMLDGMLVPIATGRIVHESHYDIARLKAQNIVLEELPPTAADVAAREAEAAAASSDKAPAEA